jgi:hypothetical protein
MGIMEYREWNVVGHRTNEGRAWNIWKMGHEPYGGYNMRHMEDEG